MTNEQPGRKQPQHKRSLPIGWIQLLEKQKFR